MRFARSTLGSSSTIGVVKRLNERAGFRKRRRPYCPSLLDTVAKNTSNLGNPSLVMVFTFDLDGQ